MSFVCSTGWMLALNLFFFLITHARARTHTVSHKNTSHLRPCLAINKPEPYYCKAEGGLNEACDPHRAAEGLFNHHRPLLTKLTRSPRCVRAMQSAAKFGDGGRMLPPILLTPIGPRAGADAASAAWHLSPSCGHVFAAHTRQSARARSPSSTADHRTRTRIQGGQRPQAARGHKHAMRRQTRLRARTRGGSKIMHARAYCWRQGPASLCA